MRAARPPLSVVIPARDGLGELEPVLEALGPELAEAGGEAVVVGDVGGGEATSDPVRPVHLPVGDILALRRRGIAEARGEVVAIGEDHALPRQGWCAAVIRAHAEHPDADGIVGCLVNATDGTRSGRANFLAFASPWQPPMAALPGRRPPPSSTISLKRSALEAIGSRPPGWLEAGLIPSLFEEGRMVADDRVVVDHHQDHGSLWSIRNAYDSARSSYGCARADLGPARRREVAMWAIANVPRGLLAEARRSGGAARPPAADLALVGLIAAAAGVGAVAGTMLGPGVSAERVA